LSPKLVQVLTQEEEIAGFESEVGQVPTQEGENVGSESEVGSGSDTGRGNRRV
jgi:hypothetical protein